MNDSVLKQTRRVLVIDDNEAIHDDFRTILTPGGPSADLVDDEQALFGDAKQPAVDEVNFEVDCALQGQEGYQKVVAAVAAGNPYHLAFVDMRMPPGWDGVQTIQKLWEADPAAPGRHLQRLLGLLLEGDRRQARRERPAADPQKAVRRVRGFPDRQFPDRQVARHRGRRS